MDYTETDWSDLLPRAVAVAEARTRDRYGRPLLPACERQALPDLAARILLRRVSDTGDAFHQPTCPDALAARIVGTVRAAATHALAGKGDRAGRSIRSLAYGRASVRAGDPVPDDATAPDPFSAVEVREEARAILGSLSDRARMVLRVERGETPRPDVPDRTWSRWKAAAMAEARTVLDARR